MTERAIAVPFTSEEIVEIAVNEFRRRLKGLSPLQGMKEYAGFDISFDHHIRLTNMAISGGGSKETLAWGRVSQGDMGPDTVPAAAEHEVSTYKSDPDVNAERQKQDLPLTVETGDGHGGKVRKKVKIKSA